MKNRLCLVVLSVIASASLTFSTAALAADLSAAGAIIGRVLNADTGQYIFNARVSVRRAGGTADAASPRETLTDDQGNFRLSNVPAGELSLHVSSTGLASATQPVLLAAGQEAKVDVSLRSGRASDAAADGKVVALDAFTVSAAKEMSATALAINSQRFSKNIRSVIAVDELGFTGDNSIAGAMKFLPGVDLEPDGLGYANGITLSGAPSANVPITFGGFELTTSADNPQNAVVVNQRTTQLGQLSFNSISRIEVNRSPTPDSPGSALAGSVNFVPKSAFEFAKPRYSLETFLTANQNRLSSLTRTAGIWTSKERQIFPGATFDAVVPLSSRFGFTLSLNHSVSPKAFQQNWMRWNANWNGATQAYFATPLNPTHYTLYEFELDDVSVEERERAERESRRGWPPRHRSEPEANHRAHAKQEDVHTIAPPAAGIFLGGVRHGPLARLTLAEEITGPVS